MAAQYFSPTPDSEDRRRDLAVEMVGETWTVTTGSGVFSGDGLDHATGVLLDEVTVRPSTSRLLDLGCGWGPLALAAARTHPSAEVWAVDVNDRARELTALNAERHGLAVRVASPDGVPPEVQFDAIWSNPPIRVGKQALHELLLRWLPRLTPDGELMMVVGRNLGADSLHRWLVDQGWPTERVASSRGFRVLRTTRPTG